MGRCWGIALVIGMSDYVEGFAYESIPRGESPHVPLDQSKLTISTQFESLPVGYLFISLSPPLASIA
jgi:hypothetical protein